MSIFYLSSALNHPNLITRKPSKGRSLVKKTTLIHHSNDNNLIDKLFVTDTNTSWIGQPGGCEG